MTQDTLAIWGEAPGRGNDVPGGADRMGAGLPITVKRCGSRTVKRSCRPVANTASISTVFSHSLGYTMMWLTALPYTAPLVTAVCARPRRSLATLAPLPG